MFFTKRKIRRTRNRNVLQTELLESRAMFSVTEMPQVDDSPIDDSGLDIPAYESPYGQDESCQDDSGKIKFFGWEFDLSPDDEPETDEPESPGTDYVTNLLEGIKRMGEDTNDLGTGINDPEPEPAEKRGKCFADLDDKDSEEEE